MKTPHRPLAFGASKHHDRRSRSGSRRLVWFLVLASLIGVGLLVWAQAGNLPWLPAFNGS